MYVIGGGFSSFIAGRVIPNTQHICFKTKLRFDGKYLQNNKSQIQKLTKFSHKPIGILKNKLLSTKIKEWLGLGGNSNVWGGFVNTSKIPESFLKKLKESEIQLIDLNQENGYNTSNSKFKQFIYKNEILNVNNLIKNYYDGYVHKLAIKKNIIEIHIKNNDGTKVIKANKVVLCLSTLQLIDLLYRSGIIENNSKISLEEFLYKIKIRFGFISKEIKKTKVVLIRFNILQAFLHLVGFQKKLKFTNIFNIVPVFIEQQFYKKLEIRAIKVKNKGLVELSKHKKSFGHSIHFCNMRINDENINSILKKINKNLYGIGMPFCKQKEPGPISNDIISDCLDKFNSTNE